MMGRGKKEEPSEKIQGDLAALGDEDAQEDPGDRIPCADETCVGAVGDDGFCGVCGRASGDVGVGPRGPEDAASEVPDADATEEVEDGEETLDEEDAGERVLCADESCVGVVDEDGYCRVCGLLWKVDGYAEGEALTYREDSE